VGDAHHGLGEVYLKRNLYLTNQAKNMRQHMIKGLTIERKN
jgi:hypothetical protein